MADLIAQGPDHRHRWRRRLPDGVPIWLGRDCGDWSLTWDPCISRRHAKLELRGEKLYVEAHPDASNPIFYAGQAMVQFEVPERQHFVIGDTTFSLVSHRAEVSLVERYPTSQQTFTTDYLRHISFRHAQKQIQALTRLPEIVAGANTDEELHARLIHLLLTGIVEAEAAAVVEISAPGEPVAILQWDRTDQVSSDFQPSGPLIMEALSSQKNVVHTWRDVSPSTTPAKTDRNDFDWALCSPIPGNDCRGRAIYVSGYADQELDESTLHDTLKFVELIGTTVGNVCDVRRLQRQATSLSQFFSPPVRDAVAAADLEVTLAPRESDVSVLFCDLRGFSRHTEESADNLLDLLKRVSESLGIMTHHILAKGGVVGDFHGDSAMGFWGWPIANPDCVRDACLAALHIQAAFEDAAASDTHALSGFRVGMGLATGQAVAGKIGTVDQVKVTAFGPVVNLASRLEGMTRLLSVPILLDKTTATQVHQQIPQGLARVRSFCKVRPYGMRSTHEVHTLDLIEHMPWIATEGNQRLLEEGRRFFEAGDWTAARNSFRRLPETDPIRNFCLSWIERHNHQPPVNWNGTIILDRK